MNLFGPAGHGLNISTAAFDYLWSMNNVQYNYQLLMNDGQEKIQFHCCLFVFSFVVFVLFCFPSFCYIIPHPPRHSGWMKVEKGGKGSRREAFFKTQSKRV